MILVVSSDWCCVVVNCISRSCACGFLWLLCSSRCIVLVGLFGCVMMLSSIVWLMCICEMSGLGLVVISCLKVFLV